MLQPDSIHQPLFIHIAQPTRPQQISQVLFDLFGLVGISTNRAGPLRARAAAPLLSVLRGLPRELRQSNSRGQVLTAVQVELALLVKRLIACRNRI